MRNKIISNIINGQSEFAHNASIKDLVAFLKKANTAYRNTGKPIVTDDVYDAGD